ncbi:MAG: aminoglycoside phosphotransferase family protein [Chlamydiales bacterium]|nr:aminoglycoside phosphotransferase family protein [Chlamydiales bacterium]
MVAIVYKVTQPNKNALILKICERISDYLREIYFLKHFLGKIPVPNIIEVVPPEQEMPGAILMECLPGTLLKPSDITESLAYELGQNFASIHLNRLAGYGDPILNQLNDDPKIYFTFKFNEGLDECRNHLPMSLLKACHRYYESHLDLLSSVDGPCIVHRDFRPGNLIVHEGKLQGIIDWAGARGSFAEEDFCSLEHGKWLNNNKTSFLLGYATIRCVPNYIPLIPFLRVNKAIATIGFTVKRGTYETSDARIYQFNRQFLEGFF